MPAGPRKLMPDDTRRIAGELIGDNQHALATLRENGSCDISYSLPSTARFRVNIFMQRGSCAIVMRVIPGNIPDFSALSLPAELKEISQSSQWHRSGNRAHRIGEVFDAGGHH